MPKSEVFCMDCMEALKTLPDNAFDLAVVDPPYGDALEHTHTHTHGRLRFHGGSKNPNDPWNKYLRPLQERAAHGLQSTEKNCGVGRSAETGIL